MYQKNVKKCEKDLTQHVPKKRLNKLFVSIKQLKNVQSALCLPSIERSRNKFTTVTKEFWTTNVQKLDR